MTRLILVLVLFAGLIAIGCSGDDETNPSSSPISTVLEPTPIQSETPGIPDPEITPDISSDILFSEEGPVSVQLTTDKLTIINNSPEVVYYYVWPVNLVGLIDWYPCENLDQCADYTSIESGQSAKRGITKNEADLIVYWWQLVHHTDGTTSADLVHEVLIKIP